MNKISFRQAIERDLHAIQILAQQLGYKCTSAELEHRLGLLLDRHDHRLIVAELPNDAAGDVIGFVHFKRHTALLSEESLEVSGLVVSEGHRRKGVGRQLMEFAEKLANEWKVKSVRLTSNVKRVEAHQFYLALGYDQPKTSHFFIKQMK